ncbi:MAG TPA: hypothetical protein VFP63_04355, partial [Dehalococcoidia bacterium]|nr:hypothetical protein [Dehalococcoidia bacterium]
DDAFGPVRPSNVVLTYTASTTYRIQLGSYSGAWEGDVVLSMALGAAIYVNSTGDAGTPTDASLTLREAIQLATGVLTYATLDPTSQAQVKNYPEVGAAGSDIIHFMPNIFLTTTPATINLGSSLPVLATGGDVVSGVGSGVTIAGPLPGIICLSANSNGNHFEGLRIQTCGDTGLWIGGTGNSVGGALSVQRNLILSSARGIWIGDASTPGSTTDTVIQGNYIGTDGAADFGNVTVSFDVTTGHGIVVAATGTIIGGASPGQGNVISGNDLTAIVVRDSSNTQVYGNKIGTDATGGNPIPNDYGIIVGSLAPGWGPSTNTQIGGVAPGYGNVIAFNGATGVWAIDSNARIQGNSIHSNLSAGISNQNPPEPAMPIISSVTGGVVSGFTCGGCTVDVYNDLAAQGRVHLGATTAGPSGAFSLTGAAHALPNITATSTNLSGFTSELTAPLPAPPNSDGDSLPDSVDGCTFAPEDVDGFEDGDGCSDTDNDLDGIPDAFDSGKLCFDPAGTLTCGTIDCRNMAEDFDAFKDSDGCPEPDNDNDGFPDSADDCPGADLHAGPDGMLGAPQDLNHNGRRDINPPDPTTEAVFTTDDVFKLMFEDYDGVLDTDGCHDSPGEDFDGDGFTDDAEALTIGTNAGYPCGYNSWPADLWDQPPLSANKITVQDLTSFIAPVRRLNTSAGNPNFSTRWDLLPGKGIFSNTINVQDMTALVTLAPPMLNGARALNGPACPYPSQ